MTVEDTDHNSKNGCVDMLKICVFLLKEVGQATAHLSHDFSVNLVESSENTFCGLAYYSSIRWCIAMLKVCIII